MLACIILFWRLDTPNLWVDELVTLQMIQGSFNDIMNACIRDIHPPLYFILLKGWSLLFGESDLWLRALSAIFASVSVIFMGMLGYRFFNERNRLLPMLLLSIHPAFIQFGRMARYYSLILMLGILCTILILNAIRTGRYKDWMFYTICSILLIYTFYPSGILLVAQGMVFVIPVWRKKAQKIWIISMLITAAAFLPWAVYVAVGQFSYTHSGIVSDLARSLIGLILGLGVSMYTFSVGETMFPWRPQAIVGLIIIMIHVVTGLFGARRSAGVRAAIISGLSMVFMSLVTTFMSVHTPFINTPVRALC